MKDLNISTRLVAAFAVLLGLLLAIGALSATRAVSVRDQLLDITERRMAIVANLELVRDEANFQARAVRNIALFNDPARIAAEKQALAESRTRVNELLTTLDRQIASARGRELMAASATARAAFRDSMDRYLALIAEGRRDDAVQLLMDSLRPLQMTYFKTIDASVDFQAEGAHAAGVQAESDVTGLLTALGASLLAALAVAVGMASWIIRSITRPLNEAVELARAVSAGDLTRQVQVRSRDEVGVLMAALGEMQAGLVRVVSQVALVMQDSFRRGLWRAWVIARWPGGFQVRGLLLTAQVIAIADAAVVQGGWALVRVGGRATYRWRSRHAALTAVRVGPLDRAVVRVIVAGSTLHGLLRRRVRGQAQGQAEGQDGQCRGHASPPVRKCRAWWV